MNELINMNYDTLLFFFIYKRERGNLSINKSLIIFLFDKVLDPIESSVDKFVLANSLVVL